ncbi:MAG: TatD family hydrolase, partial [Rectinema sp.]|nr:TatD family hydrolase [Rectinema sp.]
EALEDRVRAIRILIEDVRAGLSEARLRGIGECGLDYFHNEGSHEAQKALFEAQIECAIEFKLPLVVHSRDAFSDTLALVKRSASSIPVIIHCFGYGPREAEEFLAAGCFLSFAGNLTYPGAKALRDAYARVPLDRLLLETDAPYLNPMPHRGKPSSPLDIGRTYEYAAALRDESVDRLREAMARNVRQLFGAPVRR